MAERASIPDSYFARTFRVSSSAGVVEHRALATAAVAMTLRSAR
jgi:hypothetical protein